MSQFEHAEVTNATGEGALPQANAASEMQRRSFLAKSAVAVGGAAAVGSLWTATEQPAMAQQSRPASLRDQMKLVQRHENDHVNFIVGALGAQARPKPTFRNLTASGLFQFLTLSRTLENTGVGAYFGAAPAILDKGILGAAASIALVEARHAGLFNSLTARPMTENVFGQELSFERALTIQEVVDLAGPFIASLNGGPPLTFSSEPSASNDVAILNFALALEYLEAEFYNINVPRFYP